MFGIFHCTSFAVNSAHTGMLKAQSLEVLFLNGKQTPNKTEFRRLFQQGSL